MCGSQINTIFRTQTNGANEQPGVCAKKVQLLHILTGSKICLHTLSGPGKGLSQLPQLFQTFTTMYEPWVNTPDYKGHHTRQLEGAATNRTNCRTLIRKATANFEDDRPSPTPRNGTRPTTQSSMPPLPWQPVLHAFRLQNQLACPQMTAQRIIFLGFRETTVTIVYTTWTRRMLCSVNKRDKSVNAILCPSQWYQKSQLSTFFLDHHFFFK